MKRFSLQGGINSDEWDDSLDREELRYLLDQEKSIGNKREFFSPRPTGKNESVNPANTEDAQDEDFKRLDGLDLSGLMDAGLLKTGDLDVLLGSSSLSPVDDDNREVTAYDDAAEAVLEVSNQGENDLPTLSALDLTGFEDTAFKNTDDEHQFLCDTSGKQSSDDNILTIDDDLEESFSEEDTLIEDDFLAAVNEFLVDENDDPSDENPDWLDLADEADDFSEEITSDLAEVEIAGTVNREDRAMQAALEVGENYGLDISEIEVIAEIFTENGWGSCRLAITRQLSGGISVSELELAAAIREMWKEHCEFYRGQWSSYTVMSWPTAIQLVNAFRGVPDLEEVEMLLVRLYHHWRNDNIQRRICYTFNQYLFSYLEHIEEGFEYGQEWRVIMEETWDEELFLAPSSRDLPRYYDADQQRSLSLIRQAAL